jgi:hypothetical protein
MPFQIDQKIAATPTTTLLLNLFGIFITIHSYPGNALVLLPFQ